MQVRWLADARASDMYKGIKPFDLDGDTFRLIIAQMPDLQVHHMLVNWDRAFSLLERYPDACIGNLLNTAQRREQYHVAPVAQTIFPGLRVYMHNNKDFFKQNKLVDESGRASLTALFRLNPKMVVGAVSGRSYTKKVDALYQTAPGRITVWRRKGPTLSKGVIDMFLNNRIDMLIEYPSVLEHYAKESKQDMSTAVSYPVNELQEYDKGYIMCAKTPLGAVLADAFNKTLEAVVKRPAYLQVHLDWFAKPLHNDLLRYYNETYHTRFVLDEQGNAAYPSPE